jgi:error-prone DNA polymerase
MFQLQVASNFSFLRGASHPEELIDQAAFLGYRGIAITDFNSLAGAVRAHLAAKERNISFLVGCRLCFTNAVHILVYPTSRTAYGNLCRLLTLGKRRAPKDETHLSIDDFLAYHRGLLTILLSPRENHDSLFPTDLSFLDISRKISDGVSDKQFLSLGLHISYGNNSSQRVQTAIAASRQLSIPLAAVHDVYYHVPERRPLQDLLTCVREKTTIQKAGFRLFQNGERYLKSPKEIHRIYKDFPDALRRSEEIGQIGSLFSLDELRYEYPEDIAPSGKAPQTYLMELIEECLPTRYPEGVPQKVRKLLQEELALIRELQYEKYFLTCYDIVRFAREKKILCQGRGAAANSAVCYVLGITAVDPSKIDLLFARFVSKERNEPPDIDIDFEHERREEVIQYIYEKYGREHAGLTCEVITYRHRSAVRDIGKALGLPLEVVDKLAKLIHRWTSCQIPPEEFQELGINPNERIIQNTFHFAEEVLGFPRHLGQHVGGFIICKDPLSETVPISNARMENRTVIEWDKDDIEALGMLKIDVLGLGMLTCIRKALSLLNQKREKENLPLFDLHTLPPDDPKVYEMISNADTVGVFQIESRAQMSMLPRLRPKSFYDLVIEVAIVRPGPIQGNMVHPYLKRRNGIEKVTFPDKRVEEILGKTLGVPLFQEQAMRLAIVLAQFTPGEAEQLRRAIGAWKRNKEVIAVFHKRIIKGMMENGYTLEFAETCMSQIKGFSEYGFPESHAASFALLVYVSAWIKCHYPAEFACALLNSLPMGFYAPSQLVTDAKEHGVHPLPIDIRYSQWDCVLEESGLRLGLRLVKGLPEKAGQILAEVVRQSGPFRDISSLWKNIQRQEHSFSIAWLEAIARADAFAGLGLSRREALWEMKALHRRRHVLDEGLHEKSHKVSLPEHTLQQSMFEDYRRTGLSLKAHPLQFLRRTLQQRGVSTSLELRTRRLAKEKEEVGVAGIGIIRQRPGTANGVVFITIEDETGISNLIIRPVVFEKYQKMILTSSCLLAFGTLDRVGQVVYVSATRLESLDPLVLELDKESLPNKSYSY